MSQTSKILVVDDEPVIRDLLHEVLTDEGYSVVTAPGGKAALQELAASDDIVLLLTDIMMPEMDGIKLLQESRKVRPSLIPIVMTAYATLDSARAAVKEGAYDYVLKPFSLSEVKLAISNAMERHRLMNENARLLELTELFNISERIATIHDEQQLLDFVLRAALERVNATRGSLMVATEDGRIMEIRASVGLPDDVVGQQVETTRTIAGWVAQNAKPLLVEDLAQHPEVAEMSRHLNDRSFISVPLERKISNDRHTDRESQANGHALAVLNVSQKHAGGQFTESDLKTLSIMANHAAAALQNVRLIHDVEASHLSTVESMALLLEARDPYTQFHSQRVRDIAVAIARRLGMPQQDIDVLRIGAAFHDIGKVGIPDGVLNKPARLENDEWLLIRRHPLIGFGVLEPIHFLQPGHLDIVRSHHERLDGSGYPDGRSGSDVSPLVRIIAVADTFDAMGSDRAYRKAVPFEEIMEELRRCTNGMLDPKVVNAFIEMAEKGELRVKK